MTRRECCVISKHARAHIYARVRLHRCCSIYSVGHPHSMSDEGDEERERGAHGVSRCTQRRTHYTVWLAVSALDTVARTRQREVQSQEHARDNESFNQSDPKKIKSN